MVRVLIVLVLVVLISILKNGGYDKMIRIRERTNDDQSEKDILD